MSLPETSAVEAESATGVDETATCVQFSRVGLRRWRHVRFRHLAHKTPANVARAGTKRQFYLRSSVSKKVVHVASEVQSSGSDYALAVVERKTGRMLSCRPTRLFHVHSSSFDKPDVFLGLQAAPKTDYSMNHDVLTFGEKKSAKKEMTKLFGTKQKKRTIEDNERRVVKTDALNVLAKSALSKIASVGDDEDVKDSVSLLRDAKSKVVPDANMQATEPKDIYSLAQFVSESDVDMWNEETEKFMQLSASELRENYSEVLIPLKSFAAKQSALHKALFYYLATLIKFIKSFAVRSRKFFIFSDELQQLGVSQNLEAKIVNSLLGSELARSVTQRKGAQKFRMEMDDRERIFCHTVAMALLLTAPDYRLEVQPWVKLTSFAEPRILQLFRAVGCQVDAEKKNKLAANKVAVLRNPPGAVPDRPTRGGSGRGRGRGRGR